MTGQTTRAVAIGASAGAVQALSAILPQLPAGYPLPILIVVHVPPSRENVLVPLFQTKCRMAVKEAEDKDPILPGAIYFAPADYHLLIEADRSLSLSLDAPINYSRPSIDVFFESAAEAFGPDLTGIILTGANEDGAKGLGAIAEAGGTTLVEDPESAFATAMPDAALAACPGARPMSLDAIASHLLDLAA